jgi:hypothetical protein
MTGICTGWEGARSAQGLCGVSASHSGEWLRSGQEFRG